VKVLAELNYLKMWVR